MELRYTGPLGGLAAALLWAVPATAQDRDLGGVAEALTTQVQQIGNLVGVIAMLGGLAMLAVSAVKFRAFSNNDPQATLGGSVGWALAGVALVAFPEFMGVGIISLFGAGTSAGGFTNPLSTVGQ